MDKREKETRAETEITEAELQLAEKHMIEDIELFLNNRIFQKAPLKRFLNATLAKLNPHLSMTQVTE